MLTKDPLTQRVGIQAALLLANPQDIVTQYGDVSLSLCRCNVASQLKETNHA